MEDENLPAGGAGPETALAALAGAAAGACLVALGIAAGGFAAWAGPARPPRADLLAWAAGDVKDDRIDFLVYRTGLAVAGAGALLWCRTASRRRVPRAFTAVPLAALVAVAVPWLAGIANLATPVAAIGVVACVAALVATARSPARPDSHDGADGAFARVSAGWADLVVVGCIALVLAPVDSDGLAAALLREDHLHHWDVFAMGPAVAARGGWTPGGEIPLMYGFGPAAAIDASASALGGLTHARAIEAAAWIETLYAMVLYGALRGLGLRAAWAAFALAAAVSVERFRLVQYAPHDLMRYPSGSVLRFLFDAPWLALMAWHVGSGRRLALAGAGFVAAAAVWWITDTGLFLLMGHVACVGVLAWRAGPGERGGLIGAGLAPVLAAAGVVATYHGRDLGIGNLWEQIALRTAGYAAFPVPPLDAAHLGVYGTPLVLAALGAAAMVRRSPLAPVAAGWALYAAGCYHYYVGRSLLSSWARLAIVVGVAVTLLYLLSRRAHSAEGARGPAGRGRWGTALRCAPAAAAVAVCLTTPRLVARIGARVEPGPRSPAAAGNDPVLPAAMDPDVARALGDGIAAIRELVPAGSTAAVISDYDVLYCLGADRRPFSPRFPLLHMTLTTSQLADARLRLSDPSVVHVFVDSARPRFHWSRELVPVLREHVAASCDLVGHAGDLEIWRRRSAR